MPEPGAYGGGRSCVTGYSASRLGSGDAMARTRSIVSVTARSARYALPLLLLACASKPNVIPDDGANSRLTPSDQLRMREPEQIWQSNTSKLGELRTVPVSCKAAPETGR